MTDEDEESYEDDDNEPIEDSAFLKPDMVGYYKSVIKPDMAFFENKHIKPKIPLFTKDMKISNITDKRDYAVLNSAAYLTKYTKYIKDLAKPTKDKLSFEDWLAFDTNFRLNSLSSMNGFERKIQHSQYSEQTKNINDDRRLHKRRPFLDTVFGKGKRYGN